MTALLPRRILCDLHSFQTQSHDAALRNPEHHDVDQLLTAWQLEGHKLTEQSCDFELCL